MKNSLQVLKIKKAVSLILTVLLMILLGGMNTQAQVSFTQTLNADFYKGAYNDLIVSSDNVYLPYQATDVTTWLTTTVLPQTLEGHKAATWNNRYVYVVGGYNDLTYSTAVYRATLNTSGISSWTTLNPLPVGLRDHAVVIGTNTIYVLGGRDASNIYNTIYFATINTDGSLGTWETASVTLPANLWGHTAVYCNGYIYVAGGANTNSATAALNTVYVAKVLADNTLSAFTATTLLPATRNGHSMVTFGDKVYVIAGFANGGTKTNTVYVATSGIDGTLGAWSSAAALPVTISNHSSVIMNGLITVLAGESGGTLTNKVYYADINASPLVWNLATNVLYDYTRDGAAFAHDGWIGYCGGQNLSGTPIHNTRYANVTKSADYSMNGFFVSHPFYELGAERVITELSFAASNPAVSNTQIAYRTAGEDLDWDNWTALTSISPVTVGVTDRYLQYKVIFTGDGLVTPVFHDMNLWTPGTELYGNLNGITTFDLASSPYWVTADISFTSGTHTFDAGVELNFLPETGLTVSQANMVCNGTVADSVKFIGYTSEIGTWDGIYFDPNSDNGVSSQFYYTAIVGAGYGSWNANLYCNSTNEPLLMHCSLRAADGHGLNLNSAHLTIEETFFGGNTESGIYHNNSNPSYVNCETSNNQFAGLYLTSVASEPNFYGMLSQNNTYAMYYPSPDFTILPPNGNGLTFTGNTYNGICIEAGRVGNNQTWNSIAYDYIMLGNLVIGKAGNNCRLTIEPGNTVKFVPGANLQIGVYIPYTHYGGELYAIGTADSLITFTSYDETIGGWEGIYFDDNSDWYSGSSVMDYCVVEKGNNYNMYFYNTNQAQIFNAIIRDAILDGVKLFSSYGLFEDCDFYGFGRYPIYFENWEASPTLTNNTYSGKGINLIGYSGGHITSDRTLQNDGIDYHILNSITVGKSGNNTRLTIEPGLILNFEPGTRLQVGTYIPYSHYGGELFAEGTSGNEITFKAYNDTPGGWEGIYFDDNSDYYSGISSLDYCIIEQGNEYNLYSNQTTQPSIDNSIFRNAVQYGIKEYQSSPQIHNSQFLNNGSYPVYYTDWTCNSHLSGNTYSGNSPNKFALSGGHYTDDRILYNDGIEYLVLSDIIIGKSGNTSRLTIEPGNKLRFSSGTQLQVGIYIPYSSYGGELYAEATSGNEITFMPDSEIQGDWEGIEFDDRSDYSGATSSLKYCKVEKGNVHNVYCENTTQPAFENCEFTDALGDGLNCFNASPGIANSTFSYNGGHGIYLDGNSNPVIGNTATTTCNIFGNGPYAVYNNTSNNIDARYNYWGTGDSAMIASRIYDKYDNTAKGIVIFADFAQVPSIPSPTMILSGDVWYANSAMTQLDGATMEIFDFVGTPIANTITNGIGHYAFSSMSSGNYTMDITPSNSWSGVNSTDALMILNHFAHLDTLVGMELAASDVNVSQTVNGTDALFVMKRYSGMITSFPSGDWLYNTASLVVNGNQVTNDFEMLCFGDVNSSYEPAKKDEGTVWLAYEGSQIISSYETFTVAISIQDMITAGAVSLGLYYPEAFMEITGAEMLNATGNVIFTASDGLFRLGWADLNPINLNSGVEFLVLNCVAKDLSNLQAPILLELFDESEFADPSAQVYNSVTLVVPELVTLSVGLSEMANDGLRLLQNQPNPFNGSTVIGYAIPAHGNVSLTVLDLTGKTIAVLFNGQQSEGKYTIDFNCEGLESGIYLYKLEFTNAEINNSIVNKMSVIR
ncbi:MAG: T9SS type A sorting domain-containing protein [Bacteroidetes bacterium]|nr:T9SS type A sorting domain-containing protein [Bacteroidota bacterium]